LTRHVAAALVVALAAAIAVPATRALAAPAPSGALGGITLSRTDGGVSDTPMVDSATTSAPCPTSFGTNASLRIGRPNGPFTNLTRPLTAGGYDQAPVTFAPERSFETSLGGLPAEGQWWVVVECFSVDAGRHPQRFVTPITVSGRTWHTGDAEESTSDGGRTTFVIIIAGVVLLAGAMLAFLLRRRGRGGTTARPGPSRPGRRLTAPGYKKEVKR
jgi:hypothetical protein